MNYFFTSDTHFKHKNIIKYDNRPFDSIEEMDETIIKNWNEMVSENDIVYHLGDVCFSRDPKLLKRLNGKIHLIKGNHDGSMLKDKECVERFEWIKDYYEFKFTDPMLVLFHYPIGEWNKAHRGSVHLHGHCHGSYDRSLGKMLDVGTNLHDYKPIPLDKIFKMTEKLEVISHH